MPLDTDYRILFYTQGCEYCKMYLGYIERVNAMLRPDQHIEMCDINDPLDRRGRIFNDLVRVTPTLYIDGIVVEEVTSEHFIRGFLASFLYDEIGIRQPLGVPVERYRIDEDEQVELYNEGIDTETINGMDTYHRQNTSTTGSGLIGTITNLL